MARRKAELSPDHRAWVVENLLAGVAADALVARLVPQVPRALAVREIAAIARSPLLDVCARLAKRAQQLELVAALGRAQAAADPDGATVERRPRPPADEFFRAYWAAHRPVVLTDVTARWPALRKWTPAWFRKRFGALAVDITAGREDDPDYDANFRAHTRRVRMARFIDDVLAAGTSNDLYLVANNHAMNRRALAPLLADVRPPRDLFELPLRPKATSLWIGPGGTVTPLHHDTTNILFCQIHGRKRFELIAPHETALLAGARGFYSPLALERLADARHPALRAVQVKTAIVGPGDALFIPAGWWHRVTSLDVSISFSLLGFRRPNNLDWYRPGHVA